MKSTALIVSLFAVAAFANPTAPATNMPTAPAEAAGKKMDEAKADAATATANTKKKLHKKMDEAKTATATATGNAAKAVEKKAEEVKTETK